MTHVIKPDFDETDVPQVSGYEGFDQVFKGSGSPEGRVAANVGAKYLQRNATYGNSEWRKQSGTGTTGWKNVRAPIVGSLYDVQDYGAVGDGVTDDTAAIQAALNACPVGGQVHVPATAAGYLVSSTLTIPMGRSLIGYKPWTFGSSFDEQYGDLVAPNHTTFLITDTVNPAFIMRFSTAMEGFTFYYPNQLWAVTDVTTDTFVVYPPTIQIGESGIPSASHIYIANCLWLGATHAIRQYATDGTKNNDIVIRDCSGAVYTEFLRVNYAADGPYLQNILLQASEYGSGRVVAANGDTQHYRTLAAKNLTAFRLGSVDSLTASNIIVVGVNKGIHYDTDMFTGDTNDNAGGKWTNVVFDYAHQGIVVERGDNPFGLSLTNVDIMALLRPNGVAGDSADQAAILLTGSNVENLRMSVTNLVSRGGTAGDFVAGYAGFPDYFFRSSSITDARVQLTGVATVNYNIGIANDSAGAFRWTGLSDPGDATVGPDIYARDIEASGAITAADGFRYVVDGWVQANVAASQTNVEVSRGTGRFIPVRNGSVMGIAMKSSEARTAGTCTVTLWRNTGLAGAAGTAYTAMNTALTTDNPSWNVTTVAKDLYGYNVGDELFVKVTTSADWEPTTADIQIALECEG